jgi:hypothetical protein
MESPTAAPISPSTDEAAQFTYANYEADDIKPTAQFMDDVSRILHDFSAKSDMGIRVIPRRSNELPKEGISICEKDILSSSLPRITKDELPIPLSDPRRIFSSGTPGIKLTHPFGYVVGGPGLDPKLDTFAKDYLSRNSDIRTAADLEAAKARDIAAGIEKAKKAAEERQGAKEHNEKVHKKTRAHEDQHSMEMKLHKVMAAEQKAKREAKEKRKAEKAGKE